MTVEAMARTKIGLFRGVYSYLSNFYVCPMVYNGQRYPTAEHAFQAAKTDDEGWKKRIAGAATPGIAKALGRQAPLRADWEETKVRVMLNVLWAKFENERLRGMLLATGETELAEGNDWGDQFWGVVGGKGENWLGVLLMVVREGLQEKQEKKEKQQPKRPVSLAASASASAAASRRRREQPCTRAQVRKLCVMVGEQMGEWCEEDMALAWVQRNMDFGPQIAALYQMTDGQIGMCFKELGE